MKTKFIDTPHNSIALIVPIEALEALGWTTLDEVHIDIPSTGGGLRIYKESDPITVMGGVKEVING